MFFIIAFFSSIFMQNMKQEIIKIQSILHFFFQNSSLFSMKTIQALQLKFREMY